MNQQCPYCKETYNPVVIGDKLGYSEAITKEFYSRRAEPEKCDCLLNEIVAATHTIGAAAQQAERGEEIAPPL